MRKLAVRSPWWVFADILANYSEFDTYGALSGRSVEIGHATRGRLPQEFWANLATAPYVVYSYETPIAWLNSRNVEWVAPDVKYSRTTSAHQSKISLAAYHANKKLKARRLQ